jgi:hypothetical protein
MANDERPENFVIEAVGESKQTLSTRLPNELLLQLHAHIALEKQLASKEQWSSVPTATSVVEMLIKLGLAARRETLKIRARDLQRVQP